MKIEAGKYYKTRDGRVVGPMMYADRVPFESHHWMAPDSSLTYADDGRYGLFGTGVDSDDLISPYHK